MFKKWSYVDGSHKNSVYIYSDPEIASIVDQNNESYSFNEYGFYYGQIEDSTDTDAPVYDGMMIYFQDTLSAKSFVDDAIKYGFKRINVNEWASYYKENPSEDPQRDSVTLASMQYSAYYYAPESVASYSVTVLSHEDKNVVSLTWCP